MGQRKITWQEAAAIANKVADKAFEHLLPPLEKKLGVAAERAYDKKVKELGLTPKMVEALLEAEVLDDGCYECRVDFKRGEASNFVTVGQGARWSNGRYVPASADARKLVSSSLTISDADLADEVLTILDEISPLREKRSGLKSEIQDQLTSKSAKQVAAVWPEVAPFVNDYFNIKNGPGETMTSPFSDLIAKYLLALPAPATV